MLDLMAAPPNSRPRATTGVPGERSRGVAGPVGQGRGRHRRQPGHRPGRRGGLAAAGADVVVASRKLTACQAAADEIRQATGRRAVGLEVNVSRWDDCDRLVDAVYDAFGACHVLVNNAGMSPLYPDLVSVTEALYDKTHAVNAKGPFRLATVFGTRMHAGDGGSIINVSTAARCGRT